MSGLNNRRTNSKGPPVNRSAFRPKNDIVDDLLSMDEATRKAVMGDLRRNKPPMHPVGQQAETGQQTGQESQAPARGPEDVGTQELTTVMIGRLNDLERKCEMQRKEMSELNMKLISATDHLAEEKRRRLKAEEQLDAAIGELAQVHCFLADYGLSWVGGSTKSSRDTSPVNAGEAPAAVPAPAPTKPFSLYDGGYSAPQLTQANQTSEEDAQQPQQQQPVSATQATAANIGGARMARPPGQTSTPPAEGGGGGVKLGGAGFPSQAPAPASKPTPKATVSLPFDLALLRRQAAKLSEMVGFSGVANDAQKAIIKERDVVHVVVYLDGICVKGGPFRPYGWAFCDAFLNDLLDGYFPYEYKDRYPEGYPIEIVDKSGDVCPKDKQAGGAGPTAGGGGGGGQRLGGAGTGGNNPTTVQSNNDHGYKPITRDDIMRKLPTQYVTKSGQLINVKEGLNNFVGGSALHQAAAATAGGGDGKPNFSATVHGGSASTSAPGVDDKAPAEYPEATATIQVRMPQGQRVVLHMKKEHTVGQLREELLKASASFFQPAHGFELCTVLPRRSLTENNVSLESVGLAPSCAVFVQLKKAA